MKSAAKLQQMRAVVVEMSERAQNLETLAETAGMDQTLVLRLRGARHELESVDTLLRLALHQVNSEAQRVTT